MKIKQNQNKELTREIIKQLKENDGYCPCRLEKTPDTKCMCKEFKNMVKRGEVGECHCGLYIAEE